METSERKSTQIDIQIDISLAKWDNKEQQRIVIRANHVKILRNKGEECSFMDLGGAVVNEEPIGGN